MSFSLKRKLYGIRGEERFEIKDRFVRAAYFFFCFARQSWENDAISLALSRRRGVGDVGPWNRHPTVEHGNRLSRFYCGINDDQRKNLATLPFYSLASPYRCMRLITYKAMFRAYLNLYLTIVRTHDTHFVTDAC